MAQPVRLRIDVFDVAVQGAFARMLERGEHPAPYLDAIGATLKASTQLRFVAGKAPNGEAWAAVLRGGSPLRDTGVHLMNAVNYRVEGNTVSVGVPHAWAAVHQYGATIKAKNAPFLKFKVGDRWVQKKQVRIPARPFLGLGGTDRRDIIRVLETHLLGQTQ